MNKVIIIMDSKADLEWSQKIATALNTFEIEVKMYVASAHKIPLKCLEIIKSHEAENPVFITVAGRSNALSGFSDAQTCCPVIACPPYSDAFAGGDVFSSMRMPSVGAPLVVLEAQNAALAAAKIIALNNDKVRNKVLEFQQTQRKKLLEDNETVSAL